MHPSRFLVIILILMFWSSLVWATGISSTTRSSYMLGLRTPVRLPIFYDDSSILRFVSRTNPLSEKTYAPNDLMSISGASINQAGRSSQLRKEARDALWTMAMGFHSQFGIPLTVISAYRSAIYQQRLWDLWRCTDSLCAPPWYSEHQLGLAVDLFDATTELEYETNINYRKYVKWLGSHAHEYGWTQSYQKWAEIDEYEIEPWHYRYIWVILATRLHSLGWTYTEFVRFQEAIARR